MDEISWFEMKPADLPPPKFGPGDQLKTASWSLCKYPMEIELGYPEGERSDEKKKFSWSQVFELPFSIAQGRVTQINFKFVNSFLLIVDKNHPNIRSKKVVFSTGSVLDPPKNSLPSLGSWQGVLSSASSKGPEGLSFKL